MNDVDFHGIKVVLWDVDGTVLNFFESQKNAIRKCFSLFSLGECNDDMLADYDQINHKYWKLLEVGQLTKPQVLYGRFYEFFTKYGIDTKIIDDFNLQYQLHLGDTVCYYLGVRELIDYLKAQGFLQFAVTNGTKTAQSRKLKNSKLDEVFDEIFISEDVGYEKPSLQFFAPVWQVAKRRVPDLEKEQMLIIGDSPTSDIQLGKNAGIQTAWFAHAGEECNLTYNYKITNFEQVLQNLKNEANK